MAKTQRRRREIRGAEEQRACSPSEPNELLRFRYRDS